jgi:hypothetical protein
MKRVQLEQLSKPQQQPLHSNLHVLLCTRVRFPTSVMQQHMARRRQSWLQSGVMTKQMAQSSSSNCRQPGLQAGRLRLPSIHRWYVLPLTPVAYCLHAASLACRPPPPPPLATPTMQHPPPWASRLLNTLVCLLCCPMALHGCVCACCWQPFVIVKEACVVSV